MPRYRERDALIPRLARDLAEQLAGHEADSTLADAVCKVRALYKEGFEPISAEQFEAMLRLVARGTRVRCRPTRVRVAGSGISPAILGKYLLNPELRQAFNAARAHWIKFREFGVLEIEEIFDELATGERTLQAICYTRGWDLNRYRHLLRAIYRTPEIQQAYYRAKLSQQARVGDQLLGESLTVSTREQSREICRRMDLLRRRMPHKIRKTFHRELSPIEAARKRAGRRLNGKEKVRP